jgi:hypothetical protein
VIQCAEEWLQTSTRRMKCGVCHVRQCLTVQVICVAGERLSVAANEPDVAGN